MAAETPKPGVSINMVDHKNYVPMGTMTTTSPMFTLQKRSWTRPSQCKGKGRQQMACL